QLNQLQYPFGIFLDDDSNLYITDSFNHRIVKWNYGYSVGQLVAGGNGLGNQSDQFRYPNTNNKSIFIADGGNNRIVEWIIGDKQGIVRAGGNGAGHNLDQFYQPLSVIVDRLDNLYIADYDNNRIMRWLKNSKSGIVIIGEGAEDHGKDKLMRPTQILFDKNGNLWVKTLSWLALQASAIVSLFDEEIFPSSSGKPPRR
ncbi:unnamed protein product, partial [Rotaria sordida]